MTALLLLFVGAALWAGIEAADRLHFMRPFTVALTNESDVGIVRVDTVLRSARPSGSPHTHGTAIGPGERAVIRPKLLIAGEGAISQRIAFENGTVKETVVCGYTEYVSGRSTVTVKADGSIVVEQDCL